MQACAHTHMSIIVLWGFLHRILGYYESNKLDSIPQNRCNTPTALDYWHATFRSWWWDLIMRATSCSQWAHITLTFRLNPTCYWWDVTMRATSCSHWHHITSMLTLIIDIDRWVGLTITQQVGFSHSHSLSTSWSRISISCASTFNMMILNFVQHQCWCWWHDIDLKLAWEGETPSQTLPINISHHCSHSGS